MDSLLKNIRKIYPISEQSFEKLKKIFNEKKFKKKSALSQKNQVSTKFYIVISGIVRSYITDDKGKEHIKFIYTNYSPVAAFGSLIKKKENNVIIECLTDCDLIEVDFLEFKNLAKVNIEILHLYNNLLETQESDEIHLIDVAPTDEVPMELEVSDDPTGEQTGLPIAPLPSAVPIAVQPPAAPQQTPAIQPLRPKKRGRDESISNNIHEIPNNIISDMPMSKALRVAGGKKQKTLKKRQTKKKNTKKTTKKQNRKTKKNIKKKKQTRKNNKNKKK